jgi:hypothetical protein
MHLGATAYIPSPIVITGLLTIFPAMPLNALCDAAKRSLRERLAAYLILALIFSETLTQSVFQRKSAQFIAVLVRVRYVGVGAPPPPYLT